MNVGLFDLSDTSDDGALCMDGVSGCGQEKTSERSVTVGASRGIGFLLCDGIAGC